MTGEEIGREKKAKKIARVVIGKAIEVLRDYDAEARRSVAEMCGFEDMSPVTLARVIEILENIAI